MFHTGLNSVDSDPIIHRRDRSILIAWISCIFFNVTDADIATQRKGVPTWQPCWHVQCFNQEQRHRNYVITCLCPIRFVYGLLFFFVNAKMRANYTEYDQKKTNIFFIALIYDAISSSSNLRFRFSCRPHTLNELTALPLLA